MKLIRVLSVDGDPDFQYLLEQTVGSQPDMELVAVCSDGSQAFQAVQRHCPDIVLMDLDLRNVGRDGAETARAIRLETASKVIILTADDDPSTVIDASVRAFASGYVFKSQFTLLLPTIRETAAGPTPQSHLICAALLSTLTSAERAVFYHLLGKDVAFHSSTKTIANQQTSVLRKLGLPNKQTLRHIFSAYMG